MTPGGLGSLDGGWDEQRKDRNGRKRAAKSKQAKQGGTRRSGDRRLETAVQDDLQLRSGRNWARWNGLSLPVTVICGSLADSSGRTTFDSILH